MSAKYTWERRIERAEELAGSVPHAQQILLFYAQVLKWQHQMFRHISAASDARRLTGSLEIDHPVLLDHFASLLTLVQRHGSETLAAQANELAANRDSWRSLLASYWNGGQDCDVFFARACLQPYLELLANRQAQPFDSSLAVFTGPRADAEVQPHRRCPFCGRKPQLALLSNETDMPGVAGSAEGGRRFLMCGDCLTLWPYQRIACAYCPEVVPYKLAYYAAQDMPHIRVECCESCEHYIKSIDLTQDQRPVPLVDELAAMPLDLWAKERGYTKIRPNLAAV
jgi:FdhE protein